MLMKARTIFVAALLLTVSAVRADELWIEAEAFADKGGWVVDQQFMDQMGSSYLLAHGLGSPVAEASTTIQVPRTTRYNVWVRTFNWTAPFFAGEGPGKFRVKIGGRTLKNLCGAVGSSWQWQLAGEAMLRAGETSLSLIDLTGFDGRCDALYLTTDDGAAPPDGGAELEAFRRRAAGTPEAVRCSERYDLVVVGGGIAGMCAAVSAARLGCRVALINDRPVLGGNNSAEVRVHLGGHIELGPNEGLGRMIREFGHSRRGNAQPAEYYEDERKQTFIDAEPDIDLYAPWRAIGVVTERGRIVSVRIRQIETGAEYDLSGELFADCTGDGTIGYLAGADYLIGREARDQYGEPLAPETADNQMMGASMQWYSVDKGHATSFPDFRYGIAFDDATCERVIMGEWTWETGMNYDPIADAERIRDYGLLVVYANWSYLKNRHADRAAFRNRSLEWVAYVAGKRESRRLLGDYVLKQEDIDKSVRHEDASFTASWSIDLHFPDPENERNFPGNAFKARTVHRYIYPCAVPYRCLYSRNVDNLFMAGRNISVTHVALGTVRVMRTTGMMGEVVGMAASLCRRHGTDPRGVYRNHLAELRELMRRGVGRDDAPDNQQFNRANRLLPQPRAFLNDNDFQP